MQNLIEDVSFWDEHTPGTRWLACYSANEKQVPLIGPHAGMLYPSGEDLKDRQNCIVAISNG